MVDCRWLVLVWCDLCSIVANRASMVCIMGVGTVFVADQIQSLALDLVCIFASNRVCGIDHNGCIFRCLESITMAISADLHHTLFADVPFQVRRSRILDEALGDWNNTDAVSITIPDHTRPLDPSVALQALRTRLRNIQHVVVGLGLHRPMTDTELIEAVGVIPESLVQHNPDDCVEIDRVEGTSIGISRYLATSEWSLTVGTIEVHQYAGVSGGYKGIVVGCGSRGSIGRLHGRSFVCDPDVQVGRVSPNPFRAEIERIGQMTNCRLALAFVPSLNEWWFGHPSALMLLAEVAIQPWTPEHRAYQSVVLHDQLHDLF